MTLVEILHNKNIKTDKHYTVFEQSQHTYLDVYDEIFLPYKEEKLSFSEIGILRGESLKLWHEYFTNGKIYGLDTFERAGWNDWKECSMDDVKQNLLGYDRVYLNQVHSFSGHDQDINKRSIFFDSLDNKQLDVIVDDGSHELLDQVNTFEAFVKNLSNDGLYVIEDIGITNGSNFEPSDILQYIPELKLIDMRHVGYYDNVIGIYYNQDSRHADYLNSYIKSEKWKLITK